jgi:hypothetical protein
MRLILHYNPLVLVLRVLGLLAAEDLPCVSMTGLLRMDLGFVRAIDEDFELRLLGEGDGDDSAHGLGELFDLCAGLEGGIGHGVGELLDLGVSRLGRHGGCQGFEDLSW